jgi:hypothetical protein
MPIYSIINNEQVTNVIEAPDEQFILDNYDNNLVIRGSLPIGYTYKNGEAYKPIQVSTSQMVQTSAYVNGIRRSVSLRTFMQRFSTSQRIAIRESTDPIIIDMLDILKGHFVVELDDPTTIASVDYLVTAGYITPSDRDFVLGDA